MSEQLKRLIEEGRQKLAAAEVEKRRLYDRTIGGPIAPRPPEKFIRENVGKLKTQPQVDREAVAAVYPKMSQRAATSWVVTNDPVKSSEPQKLREAWGKSERPSPAASPQSAKQAWNKAEPTHTAEKNTSREQLRDAWNAKADPTRQRQRQSPRDRDGFER